MSGAGLFVVGMPTGKPERFEIELLKGWRETELTRSLNLTLQRTMQPVIGQKRVEAISAWRWQKLSEDVGLWANEHSRLGNLHRLDITIWLNQVGLKNRYPGIVKELSTLLEYGTHYVLDQVADSFRIVGNKLEATKLPGGGHLVNAEVCLWAEMGVMLDAIALFFALDPITAAGAPVIGGLGLVSGFVGLFLC